MQINTIEKKTNIPATNQHTQTHKQKENKNLNLLLVPKLELINFLTLFAISMYKYSSLNGAMCILQEQKIMRKVMTMMYMFTGPAELQANIPKGKRSAS